MRNILGCSARLCMGYTAHYVVPAMRWAIDDAANNGVKVKVAPPLGDKMVVSKIRGLTD